MQQTSAETVAEFFKRFGGGDGEGVVKLFHPAARIIAVREVPRAAGALHGIYEGHEGARAFLAAMGAALDTQAFVVDGITGDDRVAFSSGRFTHRLRRTGNLFSSEWAMRCVVEDGLIREYRFYEDSAAFEAANR